MSYPTIPDAKIWEAISAILHKSDADPLGDEYAEIVAEANRLAIADITRILMTRGYSGAQILAWDDRGRYNLDQAIFWSLMRAGALAGYPDNFAKTFDRRKELELLPAIMIGGEPVKPGPSAIGGISHGRLRAMRSRLDGPSCRVRYVAGGRLRLEDC